MKKIILSILAVAIVFSLAACGKSYKMKQIAKKECECKKLKKQARKLKLDKKERAYKKCKYELEAMQADFSLAYFDEMWKLRDMDELPEEWEELQEVYEEVLSECNDEISLLD